MAVLPLKVAHKGLGYEFCNTFLARMKHTLTILVDHNKFILSTNEATNKRISFDSSPHSFIRLVFVDREAGSGSGEANRLLNRGEVSESAKGFGTRRSRKHTKYTKGSPVGKQTFVPFAAFCSFRGPNCPLLPN